MTGPVDRRLLRHARSSRTGVAGLAALGAGQAAATVLLAGALTLVVAGPRGAGTVLLAVAYLARAGLAGAEQMVAQRTAARAADELRQSTLAAALRRGPAWVARYGSGRLSAALTGGLDALSPWFAGYLPALVLGVALPPLVLIAMALVDPASALIALLTLPLIPVLGALIGWTTQARARDRWAADARLAGHFLDIVQGLPTLRIHGRAERQIAVVAAMTDRHRAATMRVLRVAFLSSTALDLVGTLSVGLIAVEAGLRVAGGTLGLGPALLVILLAPEAYRPLREMAARYHAAADATAVLTDLDEVLAPGPERPAPPAVPALPTPGSEPDDPAGRAVPGPALQAGTTAQAAVASETVTTRTVQPQPQSGAAVAMQASALRVCRAGAATETVPTRPDEPQLRPDAAIAVRAPRLRTPQADVATETATTPAEPPPRAGAAAAVQVPGLRVRQADIATDAVTAPAEPPPRAGAAAAVQVPGLRVRQADIATDAVTAPAEPPPRAGAAAAVQVPGLRVRQADIATDAVTAPAGPPPRAGAAVAVRASGLRVRHPGTAVDALALDELVVRGGEIVALRGVSGAGKTTALRALAGIQELRRGRVELTGPRPLYLSQRPALPHAREVADVFRPNADLPEALRAVGLAGEVTARTPLGERGQGVSAGQRQRLALAAVLAAARIEPVVLLLDEPTAHLDLEAERLVIGQLRAAAARGCAVLVVAHRPALLAAADRTVDVAPPTWPESATAAISPTTTARPAPASATTATGPAEPASPEPEPGTGTGTGTEPGTGTGTGTESKPESESEPESKPGSEPKPTPRPEPGSESGTTTAAARQVGRLALGRLGRPAAAAGFGAASWLAGVVLTGAAGWLLVRASSLPPVLTLSAAVVLVRASAVARPLLRYLERLAGHEVAFDRLGQRRAAVYADLIPRVPGPRQSRRGELLSRVAGDVDAMVDGFLRGRLPAVSAGIAVGVAAAAVVAIRPAAGPAVAAGLVLAAGLAPALAARQAVRRAAATAEARERLNDAIVETVDGLEELAVAGPQALDTPSRCSRALAILEARAARTAGLAAALTQVGWGIAVVGAAAALSGLNREWAAVVLLALVTLGEPLSVLPDAAVARRRAAAARTRLTDLTTRPPSASPTAGPAAPTEGRLVLQDLLAGWAPARPAGLRGPDLPVPADQTEAGPAVRDPATGWDPEQPGVPRGPDLPVPADQTEAGLVVRDLVAGWDPARPAVLRGVDLRVPAGGQVAVLGPSGGGKSTLAAVLARLLDPRAGRVSLGGDSLTGLADPDVRRRVALVSADADHVFASTVRENLRLAKAQASDAELMGVQKRVGLDLDLDRWLGAGGSTISGGQRKRLATARALLADPELLILDEPTEGLDESGAQALMADLLDAAAGRSVLVLTHRGEGLDRMDAIYRLAGGVVSNAA